MKLEILCNDLPKEVLLYMKYVQRLGFEENPDYKYLKQLFKSILNKLNPKPEIFIFRGIKKENLNKKKECLNPALKDNDFRKKIIKNFKEDIINNNERDYNSLDKSSISAAPMAFNNGDNLETHFFKSS